MKYVFILCFLLVSQSIISHTSPKIDYVVKDNEKVVDLYSFVKEFIKSHENSPNKYNDKIHNDGCGNKTIGFGYRIRKTDKHLLRCKRFTISQADSLLDIHFQKALYFTDYYFEGLKEHQRYAVAHLVYCVGIGKVRKCKLVDNGLLHKDRLLQHCYIGKRLDKRRYDNRIFELDLFYR